MHVIAVPVPKKTLEFSSADEVINSLLDIRPEEWGLPPFDDWMEGTLPIEPWFISGPVIKGFGRGSKVLGIPTANLPAESFSDVVSEHTSGVYFGWARLSTRGLYKMVMSIGWNPYFDNTEKTVEPWLLHDFTEDFYGEELRLAIVGYIRPEANFPSLESLIERIHEDGRIAEKALDLPVYAKYKDSPNLRNPLQQANSVDGQAELNLKDVNTLQKWKSGGAVGYRGCSYELILITELLVSLRTTNYALCFPMYLPVSYPKLECNVR